MKKIYASKYALTPDVSFSFDDLMTTKILTQPSKYGKIRKHKNKRSRWFKAGLNSK